MLKCFKKNIEHENVSFPWKRMPSLGALLTIFFFNSFFGFSANSNDNSRSFSRVFIEKGLKDFPIRSIQNEIGVFHLFSHGSSGELFIDGHWLQKEEIAEYIFEIYNISVTSTDNGISTETDMVLLSIAAVNDAPVATNDTFNLSEDTSTALNVLTKGTPDSDLESNVKITSTGSNSTSFNNNLSTAGGVLSININGTDSDSTDHFIDYTPPLNYFGNDTLYYIITDAEGATDTAMVLLSIAAVNDAPVAVKDTVFTNFNVNISFNIITNDSDIDGFIDPSTVDLDPNTLAIESVFIDSLGNDWTVNTFGEVLFNPDNAFEGKAVLSYRVSDNDNSFSNNANLEVTVLAAVIECVEICVPFTARKIRN